MDIVLCTDNNYCIHTGILMCSICDNNDNVHYHIVISEDVTVKNKRKLESVALKYNAEIAFYTINPSIIDSLPFGKEIMPQHVSVVTYFRLFLTEILPSTLSKVLYLDVDMICAGTLSELWDRPLSDKPLVAVTDMDANDPHRYARLGYDSELGYFNAGVLLINLDYWRNERILLQFSNFMTEHSDRIIFHDQDVLNHIFAGKAELVDIDYNLQNGFLRQPPSFIPNHDTFDYCIKHPKLIHYTYIHKPWIKGSPHPYTSYYLHYKKLSPWRYRIRKSKEARSVKEWLVNVLVRLGIHTYNSDYIPPQPIMK